MSDGEKIAAGVAVVGLGALGVFGLYYLVAGLGRENNAALIPDVLEDRIDHVVDVLNAKVGKGWVTWGAEKLKAALRNSLPGPLVTLVDVVYAVEQKSRQVPMSCHAKRQCASATAVAWGLG